MLAPLLLIACASKSTATPDSEDPATEDTADTADTGAPDDTADTAEPDDSGDSGDTGVEPPAELGWRIGDVPATGLTWPVNVGDVDGDGVDDLFLFKNDVVDSDATMSGVSVFMPGHMPAPSTVWRDEPGVESWKGDFFSVGLTAASPAGDVDGDGFADVWLRDEVVTDADGYSLFLLRGPASRWAADGADARAVADAAWDLPVAHAIGGWPPVVDPADFDDDGLVDGLVWSSIAQDDGTSLAILALVEGMASVPASRLASDGPWLTARTLGAARMVEDIDGDGLREVLAESSTGLAIVEGADLLAGSGQDAAPILLSQDASISATFVPGDTPVLGDRDGDGRSEVLWWDAHLLRTGSTLCLREASVGATLPSGALADLVHTSACWDDTTVPTISTAEDADADGLRDVIVGGRHVDGDRASCVLPSSAWPSSGTFDPTDVSFCSTEYAVTTLADLDGDGALEWLGGDATWTETLAGQGRVWVLPSVF